MAGIPCPNCPETRLNPVDFQSMVVLSRKAALFALRCPTCGSLVSVVQEIPVELRPRVADAARRTGAGMGCER